jgi:hypothetical protein
MKTLKRKNIRMVVSLVALAACGSSAHADLIHRYSFNTDASDSVGGANGTLMNSATVSGGQLQLNNPNFSGSTSGATDPHGYLSLPASVLPTSGSATIEDWFTFTGSGFYTEAWTFSNGTDASPPVSGQYLMQTISAPQPAAQQAANTGGNHIVESLNGYNPGPETDAYGTTPGMGAGGGGYLDNGDHCFSATVIGADGTLSYYLYDITTDTGGLQSTVSGIPLSSFQFTDAYLGRSAFSGDNATSGAIDEFRIYNDAQTAPEVLADYLAGPDTVVPTPEPSTLGLAAIGALGLGLLARRRFQKA